MEKKTLEALSHRLRKARPVPDAALPYPIQSALLKLAAKELQDEMPKVHRQSA